MELGKTKTNRTADIEVLKEIIASGGTANTLVKLHGWTKHRAYAALKALNESAALTPDEEASCPSDEAAPREKKPKARISELPVVRADLAEGRVHRFIISGAQDDTDVFEPFLKNLEAYADYLGAEIVVGGYTYQLGLFEDHSAEANIYDSRLAPYLRHERIQYTDDLLYLGNANILPTTANPLNGWQTANKGGHVVIPHSRIALESIPRMQSQAPRYVTSTGTVTKPNYTARAAGQKSIFHHTYGAVIVEIDSDGEVFMRHVIADAKTGAFQDLDIFVSRGRCTPGRRVLAITWGDVHHEQLDEIIAWNSWGYSTETKRPETSDNLLDGLMPEYQFLHDTLDFRRRNHHSIRDPHERARVRKVTNDNVEGEVAEAANFVNMVRRDWCRTVVVESNHDAALARWLKDPEGALDAENAYYWHQLNATWHKALRNGEDINIIEEALLDAGLALDVEFVSSGGSYTVLDVECGLHGDLGIGGSRGSPNQYRRLGSKTSSGHTHSPKIVDGVYVAGVTAKLDQGYNKSPTTWAHAHIILYHSGKRCLLTMTADGRHRAMGDRKTATYFETQDMLMAA